MMRVIVTVVAYCIGVWVLLLNASPDLLHGDTGDLFGLVIACSGFGLTFAVAAYALYGELKGDA